MGWKTLTESEVVGLGGAYVGEFSSHVMSVEVPAVGFADLVIAVAIPDDQAPSGLDGIAAFRFLNEFIYGNFGDANAFGLEKVQ